MWHKRTPRRKNCMYRFVPGWYALQSGVSKSTPDPETPDPETSAKVSRCKWRGVCHTHGWRRHYFHAREGHTFAKVFWYKWEMHRKILAEVLRSRIDATLLMQAIFLFERIWVHRNRTSPFAGDFHSKRGHARNFHNGVRFRYYNRRHERRLLAIFDRKGIAHASWGVKKSRFFGSGQNRCNRIGAEAHPRSFCPKTLFIPAFPCVPMAFSEGVSIRELRTQSRNEQAQHAFLILRHGFGHRFLRTWCGLCSGNGADFSRIFSPFSMSQKTTPRKIPKSTPILEASFPMVL